MATKLITKLACANNYYCTNSGEILNKKGRVLCGYKQNGYIRHRITVNGQQKTINTARAIYESFCGQLDKGVELDHRDGCKTNNRLNNLRPVSHKENMNNPVTKARLSKPHRTSSKKYEISELVK